MKFAPPLRTLGGRNLASIRADVTALLDWVQRQENVPGRNVRAGMQAANVTLWLDLDADHAMPIARVELREGYWHIQWADRSDRWHDYDDKAYLTLAIPMDLIDQDPESLFWG